MSRILDALSNFVFGDQLSLGEPPRVTSYEAVHSEAQSILVPAMYPRGLFVSVLQPTSKRTALTATCVNSWTSLIYLSRGKQQCYCRLSLDQTTPKNTAMGPQTTINASGN